MGRFELLWLAFEKFALFFAFVVTLILVLALAVVGIVAMDFLPALPGLRDGTVCPMIADINSLVTDLENAVITRTIPISQTIPVVFDLPLNQNTSVELTKAVALNRPATFTFPAGGGQINGQVYLALPQGQDLPVHLSLNVPVRQDLPVRMDVAVAIPLKETDLGPVIEKLKSLLLPYMELLGKTLKCRV